LQLDLQLNEEVAMRALHLKKIGAVWHYQRRRPSIYADVERRLLIREGRSSAFSLNLTGWKPVVCIRRMENQISRYSIGTKQKQQSVPRSFCSRLS